MISMTVVIQMEITKEFDLARHRGGQNVAMVKAITFPELKFPKSLKSMMMLGRILQLQRMKWCL